MRRRALLCCAALCCAAVGAAVDGAAVDGAFVADGAYAAEGASVDGASVERASVVYAMETYCQCRTNETESGLMIDGLRHRRKNGLGLSVDVFGESGCRVSNTFLQRLKRPDPPQLTVLVLAYLPALNHRVERLACAYATVRAVRKVLVLWNGPAGRQPNASCAYGWRQNTEQSYIAEMPRAAAPATSSLRPAEIEVIIESRNTLLNRYRHADRVPTPVALLQDDDVLHAGQAIEAFAWLNLALPSQVLGVPPERDWNVSKTNARSDYRYVYHPRKGPYSFLLGQTSVLATHYLRDYVKHVPPQALKYIVTHKPTCEDLTLHFFTSNRTRMPPALFQHLKPKEEMGGKSAQMHSSVSKKAWSKRRERCLQRLVNDFKRMPLVKSRCRIQGDFRDLPFRA